MWWDDALRTGDSYDEVIEENLRQAGAVVVVWSTTSIKSKWVRAEATAGERHSTLVPAMIEICDVPIRFELMHTADLQGWQGDHEDRNWRRLVADIHEALQKKAEKETGATDDGDAADSSDVESAFWSTIKHSRDPSELSAYLKRYNNGRYAAQARTRLAALTAGAAKSDKSVETNPSENPAGIPRPLIAISIFAVALIVGIVMLIIANGIHISFFTWTPVAGEELLQTGAKEVGFYFALNWSLAMLFLMPTAWTMIYLALASLRDVEAGMIERRMLVTKDFAPVTSAHHGVRALRKHLSYFVVGGIGIVTAIMVMLAMSDHAQVAGQFYGDEGVRAKLDRIDGEGFALEAANIERDWMVASFLTSPQTDAVNVTHNNAFSLANYIIYVGMGIGSLLSFGLVMIGLGAAFMRGVAQNYGLQIIPSLSSKAPGCGFEVVQRFFGYAFAVALIGCAMIYLMGIQNLYLRSPDPSIFAFLTPDFSALAGNASWSDKVDALIGFLFSDNVGKGTRNAYAWVFGFFIFAVFIGGFMAFLRNGAHHSRSVVLAALKDQENFPLDQLSRDNEETIAGRLGAMRIWPLEQPSLRMSYLIMVAFAASMIFYKLGLLIVIGIGAGFFLTLRRPSPA